MRPIALLLTLLCSAQWVLAAAPPYANPDHFDEPVEEPPITEEPIREPFGLAVYCGQALVHWRRFGWVFSQPIDLDGPARRKIPRVVAPYGSPFPKELSALSMVHYKTPLRWQARGGRLFIHAAPDGLDSDHLMADRATMCYSFQEILKCDFPSHGLEVKGRPLPPEPETYVFTNSSPGQLVARIAKSVRFDAHFYYDYLPDADGKGMRQFILTDARGELVPAKGPDEGAYIRQSEEEREHPFWTLRVHRCRVKPLAKPNRYEQGEWTRDTDLPVAFREHFRVLAHGPDWYFLTASGKLFVSPRPKPGRARTMSQVKLPSPVLGTITDAQTGKHFLFVNTPEGQAFFEPALKPKLVAFDPKAAKVPEGDDPLRGILHKARILAALGKIKGK